MFRPELLAADGVEAGEVPLGAQRIDLAASDRRSAAGAAGIGDRIRAVVFMLPQQTAVVGSEAEHPFAAGDF